MGGLRRCGLIPLSEEVMFKATELPAVHRDPADRFIIATASLGNLTVVTTDRRFLSGYASHHTTAIHLSVEVFWDATASHKSAEGR